MTAALLAALAGSMILNVAMAMLIARIKHVDDKINVIEGVMLPLPDDPDWKEQNKTWVWNDVPRFDVKKRIWVLRSLEREIYGLELGAVRIERIDYTDKLPDGCGLAPIHVDSTGIGKDADIEKANRYVKAVWTAYMSRRSMESATQSPLLGSGTP